MTTNGFSAGTGPNTFLGVEFPKIKGAITITPNAQAEQFSGNGDRTITKIHGYRFTDTISLTIWDPTWLITNNFDIYKSFGELQLYIQRLQQGGDPDTGFDQQVYLWPTAMLTSYNINVPIDGGDSDLSLTFESYNEDGNRDEMRKYVAG